MIKPIPGCTPYFADEDGNIYSGYSRKKYKNVPPKTPHIRKAQVDTHGYRSLMLSINGKKINKKCAVLVLTAFVSPRPKGMQACHGVLGRKNDSLPNLRWGTASENQLDRLRDGTDNRGSKAPWAKLSDLQIRIIRHSYVPRVRHARRGAKNSVFGLSYAQLAKTFHVCPMTIWHIVNNKTWSIISKH